MRRRAATQASRPGRRPAYPYARPLMTIRRGDRQPGDRLFAAGAVVFAAGLVATVLAVAGVLTWWAVLLVPAGLALALAAIAAQR